MIRSCMTPHGRLATGLAILLNATLLADLTFAAEKSATISRFRWNSSTIPVCWENPSPDDATQRELVRQAVSATWEKYSAVRLLSLSMNSSNSLRADAY